VLIFKRFYVIDGAKDAWQIVMDLQSEKFIGNELYAPNKPLIAARFIHSLEDCMFKISTRVIVWPSIKALINNVLNQILRPFICL